MGQALWLRQAGRFGHLDVQLCPNTSYGKKGGGVSKDTFLGNYPIRLDWVGLKIGKKKIPIFFTELCSEKCATAVQISSFYC